MRDKFRWHRGQKSKGSSLKRPTGGGIACGKCKSCTCKDTSI